MAKRKTESITEAWVDEELIKKEGKSQRKRSGSYSKSKGKK
jgi:hypothetical protein